MASRESIIPSCFLEPVENNLEEGWVIFSRLLAGNGGHPQMGQELKNLLVQAGFTNVNATASFDFFGLEQDVLQSIARIQANPFIPLKDEVRGFIYDCVTGPLNEVSPG